MKTRLSWSNRPNRAAGTAAPPRPGGYFHPTDRSEPRRRDSTRELGRFRASSSSSSPPTGQACRLVPTFPRRLGASASAHVARLAAPRNGVGPRLDATLASVSPRL
ncbi:hypothetical protein ABZP36_016219 [Zizania latifolia]